MTLFETSRRTTRSGKGLLPPNPKQWSNEHNGLDLRDELGLSYDNPLAHLEAFRLLPKVVVLPHGKLPAAAIHIDYLRSIGRSRWSGIVIPLEDGRELVLFNDAHATTRTRATLLEEFFHIALGHPRSVVRVLSNDHKWRTHDPEVEEEAYGSGAAALVPYTALRAMVAAGITTSGIARHFQVSPDLVGYRLNVTRLQRRRSSAGRRGPSHFRTRKLP